MQETAIAELFEQWTGALQVRSIPATLCEYDAHAGRVYHQVTCFGGIYCLRKSFVISCRQRPGDRGAIRWRGALAVMLTDSGKQGLRSGQAAFVAKDHRSQQGTQPYLDETIINVQFALGKDG